MDLQEILKAQGMDEEHVAATLAEMKKNKIFTTATENVDTLYGDLKRQHEELKKSSGGNEQDKARIKQLEAELAAAKADAALDRALLEAKVMDVDYMKFKIRERGEVKLDDKGKIQGFDDTLAAMKTQFPNQFPKGDNQRRKVEENKLPDDKQHDNDDNEPKTLAEALEQAYKTDN